MAAYIGRGEAVNGGVNRPKELRAGNPRAEGGCARRLVHRPKDLITIPSEIARAPLYSPGMGRSSRATRGGVGAVFVGAVLASGALASGWVAGLAYDALTGADACGAACSPSSAAAEEPVEPAPERVSSVAGVAVTPTPAASDPSGFPFISAQSIAVIDSACGGLIYGRDEDRRMPPASLTKLMTAAVAAEQSSLDEYITANVDGAALHEETGSTIMGLVPGMQLTLRDLLYGLLLPSGNDAAIAIAERVGGSQAEFAEMMNEKARSLDLDDSHFTNPHGLDEPALYSSAHDMAMLARYVMQDADLREIVGSVSYQTAWDGPPVWNGNKLLQDYEGADGVKIGYTEGSQQTIVASATHAGRRVIVSLMRSQDRYSDAMRLFDWAFEQPSACP